MEHDVKLDDMLKNSFLDDLDESMENYDVRPSKPSWVSDDENKTTHKAWTVINTLKLSKQESIILNKKLSLKTAKSVYQIAKSEVSREVGITAQSIFRTSSFSCSILQYFDEVNAELHALFKKMLSTHNSRKSMGVRNKKKEEVIKNYQTIVEELDLLKKKTVKDVLDLAVNKIPIDLRTKIGF